MSDVDINIKINAINNAKAAFSSIGDTLDGFTDDVEKAKSEANKYFEQMEAAMLDEAETAEEVAEVHAVIAQKRLEFEQATVDKIKEIREKELRETLHALRDIGGAYRSVEIFVKETTKALDDQKLSLKEVSSLLGKLPTTIVEVVEGLKALKLLLGTTGIAAAGFFAILAVGAVAEYENYKRNVEVQKSFDDLSTATADASGTYQEYVDSLGLADTSSRAFAASMTGMTTGMYNVQMGAVAMSEAEWEAAKATENITGEFTSAEQSLLAYVAALYEAEYGTEALEAAQSLMKTTASFVREAFKEQGLELANNKWLMDQIALATGDLTEGQIAQREIINTLTASLAAKTITEGDYLAAILATNDAMKDGIITTEELNAILGILPREIGVKIGVQIAGGAALANLIAGLSSLGGMDIVTGFGARAGGGPVNSGQPYLVGEAGPELMVPNHSGTIIPNNKLGGNITVIINTPVNLADEVFVERKLYPFIKAGLKEAMRGA